MIKVKRQTCTHNKKSCSQQGLAPFTVTVVDLTFCSFSVTYESFWTAEKNNNNYNHFTSNSLLDLKMVMCYETETSASSFVLSVHSQIQSTPEDYGSDNNYDVLGNISKKSPK